MIYCNTLYCSIYQTKKSIIFLEYSYKNYLRFKNFKTIKISSNFFDSINFVRIVHRILSMLNLINLLYNKISFSKIKNNLHKKKNQEIPTESNQTFKTIRAKKKKRVIYISFTLITIVR